MTIAATAPCGPTPAQSVRDPGLSDGSHSLSAHACIQASAALCSGNGAAGRVGASELWFFVFRFVFVFFVFFWQTANNRIFLCYISSLAAEDSNARSFAATRQKLSVEGMSLGAGTPRDEMRDFYGEDRAVCVFPVFYYLFFLCSKNYRPLTFPIATTPCSLTATRTGTRCRAAGPRTRYRQRLRAGTPPTLAALRRSSRRSVRNLIARQSWWQDVSRIFFKKYEPNH
jgi:hypothetical protein